MQKLSSLIIGIPTYNNQATIARAVSEAVAIGQKVASKFEVVVINDASSDNTATILTTFEKNPHVRIITHKKNQGYGSSIAEIYMMGRTREWIFTAPGDYQIPAGELLKLYTHAQHADMIIGWRKDREDPFSRLIQSAIYNLLLRLVFHLSIRDINSVRLMRGEIMKHIKFTSTSAFVDAELVVRTKRAGYRIIEIPIGHLPDAQKGSGGSWKTVTETIGDLVYFARTP